MMRLTVGIKEVIRDLIEEVRTSMPNGSRQFLDKSKDFSMYDVDDPRLPLVNKTITIDSKKKVRVKKTKTK